MNKTRNKKIYSFSILGSVLVASFLAYIISNLFFSAVLFAIIGLALIFFAGQDYARLNRMAHEYKHGSQDNTQANPFKSSFNPQNNANFGNNTKKESPLADFYMKQERPVNFQKNEQNNNEDTIFYDSEYAASGTIFVNKKDDDVFLPECFKYFGFTSVPNLANLKSAYRKKAKVLHPDKGGDPVEFKKMNDLYDEALEILNKK